MLQQKGSGFASVFRKLVRKDNAMPNNGEWNLKFGVYKNLCCAEEIVIPEGKKFPDCAKHPNLTTTWRPVVSDSIVRLGRSEFQSQTAGRKRLV